MKNNNIISIKYEDLKFIKQEKNGNNITDYYVKIPPKNRMCPCCKEKMHICSNHNIILKDFPTLPKYRNFVVIQFSRFRCVNCNSTMNDEIPIKEENTFITKRCAIWIKDLLSKHMTIKDINLITGVHWNTIRNIHKKEIDEKLLKRKTYLKFINYKPKNIAIDEFAILKGHKYATIVLDLDLGEAIWIGKGRSKECFKEFFTKENIEYLSEVKAASMDMNVAYNQLIKKYLPHIDIVYDRYHFQSDYGKNVMGKVRLDIARENKEKADTLKLQIDTEEDLTIRKEIKQNIKSYTKEYSSLKNARWLLLRNNTRLNENEIDKLNKILIKHREISICYAMKEEISRIYSLKEYEKAKKAWQYWFEASKSSGIEALSNFAIYKEKRLEGLVMYSTHNISTGKLEGLNNKVKVCKRMAYGYRNIGYFFSLLKYLMLPKEYR